MKIVRNSVLALLTISALAFLPSAWAEAEPTPTPHEEPTPTPHQEPSASPHEEPTPTPDGEPGDDDGDHGNLSLHGFYEGTTASGALAVRPVATTRSGHNS